MGEQSGGRSPFINRFHRRFGHFGASSAIVCCLGAIVRWLGVIVRWLGVIVRSHRGASNYLLICITWSPPMEGHYKINFDTEIRDHFSTQAAICRDHIGSILKVVSQISAPALRVMVKPKELFLQLLLLLLCTLVNL
jgi:hypothetical protein